MLAATANTLYLGINILALDVTKCIFTDWKEQSLKQRGCVLIVAKYCLKDQVAGVQPIIAVKTGTVST